MFAPEINERQKLSQRRKRDITNCETHQPATLAFQQAFTKDIQNTPILPSLTTNQHQTSQHAAKYIGSNLGQRCRNHRRLSTSQYHIQSLIGDVNVMLYDTLRDPGEDDHNIVDDNDIEMMFDGTLLSTRFNVSASPLMSRYASYTTTDTKFGSVLPKYLGKVSSMRFHQDYSCQHDHNNTIDPLLASNALLQYDDDTYLNVRPVQLSNDDYRNELSEDLCLSASMNSISRGMLRSMCSTDLSSMIEAKQEHVGDV